MWENQKQGWVRPTPLCSGPFLRAGSGPHLCAPVLSSPQGCPDAEAQGEGALGEGRSFLLASPDSVL